MSWLSKAVGKIPVVGHALNQVGKVLPSGGGLIGGAALGLPGLLAGTFLDPNSSKLQKGIATGVGAAGAGLGLAGLGGAPLGAIGKAIPGIVKGAGGVLPGIMKKATGGGVGLGDIADIGLGTAGLVNAGQLADKSNQYAQTAYGDVRNSYDARQGLRERGILGLQNPGAGVPLAMQNVKLNTGISNPFFKKPVLGQALL